jgi:hypothetical protein
MLSAPGAHQVQKSTPVRAAAPTPGNAGGEGGLAAAALATKGAWGGAADGRRPAALCHNLRASCTCTAIRICAHVCEELLVNMSGALRCTRLLSHLHTDTRTCRRIRAHGAGTGTLLVHMVHIQRRRRPQEFVSFGLPDCQGGRAPMRCVQARARARTSDAQLESSRACCCRRTARVISGLLLQTHG